MKKLTEEQEATRQENIKVLKDISSVVMEQAGEIRGQETGLENTDRNFIDIISRVLPSMAPDTNTISIGNYDPAKWRSNRAPEINIGASSKTEDLVFIDFRLDQSAAQPHAIEGIAKKINEVLGEDVANAVEFKQGTMSISVPASALLKFVNSNEFDQALDNMLINNIHKIQYDRGIPKEDWVQETPPQQSADIQTSQTPNAEQEPYILSENVETYASDESFSDFRADFINQFAEVNGEKTQIESVLETYQGATKVETAMASERQFENEMNTFQHALVRSLYAMSDNDIGEIVAEGHTLPKSILAVSSPDPDGNTVLSLGIALDDTPGAPGSIENIKAIQESLNQHLGGGVDLIEKAITSTKGNYEIAVLVMPEKSMKEFLLGGDMKKIIDTLHQNNIKALQHDANVIERDIDDTYDPKLFDYKEFDEVFGDPNNDAEGSSLEEIQNGNDYVNQGLGPLFTEVNKDPDPMVSPLINGIDGLSPSANNPNILTDIFISNSDYTLGDPNVTYNMNVPNGTIIDMQIEEPNANTPASFGLGK